MSTYNFSDELGHCVVWILGGVDDATVVRVSFYYNNWLGCWHCVINSNTVKRLYNVNEFSFSDKLNLP